MIGNQRRHADSEIDVESVAQFARDAVHNSVALLDIFARFIRFRRHKSPKNFNRIRGSTGLFHRAFFDSALIQFTLKNSFHVDRGRMDRIAIKVSRLDQMFNFSDSHLRRGRHDGVKIARRLAIDKVSHAVAFPGFYEGEIGGESALHHVNAAVEFARFFSIGNDRAYAGGSEERRNSCARGANALRKSPLRHEIELHLAGEDHGFEQFILAHVRSDVAANLAGSKQQSDAETINASVIADGREILRSLAHQRPNQILRNAAQAESTEHDGSTVAHIANGIIGISNDFIHRVRILNEIHCTGTEARRTKTSERSSNNWIARDW